jgi:hypothetical protein
VAGEAGLDEIDGIQYMSATIYILACNRDSFNSSTLTSFLFRLGSPGRYESTRSPSDNKFE